MWKMLKEQRQMPSRIPSASHCTELWWSALWRWHFCSSVSFPFSWLCCQPIDEQSQQLSSAWCLVPFTCCSPVTRSPGGRLDPFCVLPVIWRQGPSGTKLHKVTPFTHLHTFVPNNSRRKETCHNDLQQHELLSHCGSTCHHCHHPMTPCGMLFILSSCQMVDPALRQIPYILGSFVGVSWHCQVNPFSTWWDQEAMILVCCTVLFFPVPLKWSTWPRAWVVQLTILFSRNLFEHRAHLFTWRPSSSSGLALIGNLGKLCRFSSDGKSRLGRPERQLWLTSSSASLWALAKTQLANAVAPRFW